MIAPEIRTADLVIPGGWTVQVPKVKADEASLEALTAFFVSDGLTPARARERAIALVQERFQAGWWRTLRESIARRARIYANRYGDLRGFDPQRLQWTYVPGALTGRSGNSGAARLMAEMRKGAEADEAN